MKRIHYYIVLLWALSSLPVAAQEVVQEQTLEPDTVEMQASVPNIWRPLFGEGLQEAVYNPEAWVYENGLLTALADEPVWTAVEYENFEMDIDFKNDEGTNSGIIIYGTDLIDWIPNSVEIQLADDYYPDWSEAKPYERCGAVYGHLGPRRENLVKMPGEWNHIRIKCVGQSISVILNGRKAISMNMSEYTSATTNPDGTTVPEWLSQVLAEMPTKGYIGLQGKHGNAGISFRNFKIRNAQ